MATANESRFYAALKEAQSVVSALESVLNILTPPSELSRQAARQKLGDLKLDAATYLGGNKSKAVIAKLINATELWDFLKARGESQNTISKRVSRYLVEVQTILGMPENQIPVPTGDEGEAARKIKEAADKVKEKEEAGGTKVSGGLIAAIGVGALGLLWFLKRRK